jgi:hypothetical protein
MWGIIFIFLAQPNVTAMKFHRFIVILFVLMGLSVIGYSSALIRAPEPSSANFPGKIIATQLTQTWHEKFHTPLAYVAGSRWVAGNVAFYSADRPAVYIDWNKSFSPWIDEKKLKSTGAVFIWDLTDGKTITPAKIQERFATLGPIETQHYAWMRNKNMPPVEFLVAWLAPENAVFLDLRRRGDKVYYYITTEGYDVDFLSRDTEGKLHLYQVAYEIEDEKTKIRENRALIAAEKELGIKGTMITRENYPRWALERYI